VSLDVSPAICHTRAADGTRIAYHTLGTGPPLVLLFPYHVNDLLLNWGVPVHRQAMRYLANYFTVVNLDLRGAGQSERGVDVLTLDLLCDDMRAVFKDVGAERVSLCALGSSALPAAYLAVTSPERVHRLVLLQAGETETSEQIFALRTLNPTVGSDLRASVIAGVADPDNAQPLAAAMRAAVDPVRFALYEEVRAASSLDGLLSRVETPTLFLHAEADELIPIDIARGLAASIRNAHLLAVPGSSGLAIWKDDFAVDRLVAFASGAWSGDPTDAPRSKASAATPALTKPGGLTERELDVLRLVALGRTNMQIRDELFISLNTVSHHLRAIFARTGSANRTEAAAFAHRHGLIR
jgi:DNA-binding CsgD family transcriptional regulator/pimeloyl-ACP methyl ester carboxylesterase